MLHTPIALKRRKESEEPLLLLPSLVSSLLPNSTESLVTLIQQSMSSKEQIVSLLDHNLRRRPDGRNKSRLSLAQIGPVCVHDGEW